MSPDTMSPRRMSHEPSSDRLTRVEEQVGTDGDTGMRGEIKDIKKQLRAMELRLYGVIAAVGLINYAVFGKTLHF